MKIYFLDHLPRNPPKGRYHYCPQKILEPFENIEKYAVFYRILHPGSTDPYKLGAIPKESCQDGVVNPDMPAYSYPALVATMWSENFCKVTCPHCNHTPCPSNHLVHRWIQMMQLGRDRKEYKHPGHLNGWKLKTDHQYMTTWLQQKYRDYVLKNSRDNMNSQDGIKYRCLCIEEEIACQFPERCHACGFKPCLVHQAGKMIYNYLQGEWAEKHDVVKFREMMAGFKREWEIRKGLRDDSYTKEIGGAYRPAWMSDDLFSHGHGPECVDKYARLLFPKAAISMDTHGMYPTGDARVLGWSPDEGHLYDLEASRVAYHNWLLWCEDADEGSSGSVDSFDHQVEQSYYYEICGESSESEDSLEDTAWVRGALRKKNKRRWRQTDRTLKRKFVNYDTSDSEESSVKGGHQVRVEGHVPGVVQVPLL